MTGPAYIGPTIGASEVADCCGIGWHSPVRKFGELTHARGFERDDDTEAQAIGRDLQTPIFRALERNGYAVSEYVYADEPRRADRDLASVGAQPLRDSERPWLVGHPDGYGYGEHDGLVFDAKARSWRYDENPTRVQLLVYMHLGGFAGGVAAILHNLHLDVEEVEREERRIDVILALLDDFYDHVRRGEWPAATGHPDDRAALATAYLGEPGKRVRETREIRDARRELAALNEQDGKHGARSRRKNMLAGQVTEFMGDATELVSLHDEVVARWTPSTTRRFDSARFKKEHPQLHEQYVTESHTRRLTVG